MSSSRLDKFIKKANVKFNNKFDYSKVKYINNHTKVKIICPEHGEFEQTPDNHLNSKYGCPECTLNYNRRNRTIKTFTKWINIAKDKFNSKYTYYIDEYINSNFTSNDKVRITCPKHGDFEQLIYDHAKSQYGCKFCAGEITAQLTNTKRSETLANTFAKQRLGKKEQFVEKANSKFNNKFDYSKFNYDGNDKESIIICPEHGEWTTSVVAHLNSTYGCPSCANIEKSNNMKLTQQEFIKNASIIHNGKYDYSKSKYIDMNTPVTIICKSHGEFEQTPASHIHSKQGCPKCGLIISNTESEIIQSLRDAHLTKIIERIIMASVETRYNNFINKANIKFSSKFTYPDFKDSSYVNNESDLTISCPEHGNFTITAQRHLQSKHGCPKCAVNFRSLSYDEFVKQANIIHHNKYTYPKFKYINVNQKINIICSEHGIFNQKISQHIHDKQGCPKCYYDSKRTNTQDFITAANIIHNNKYNYSESKITENSEFIDIICPIHGKFTQRYGHHIYLLSGCPKCANSSSKSETEIIETFPEIKIIQNDRKLIAPKEIDILIPDFKIGIEYNGLLFHSYGTTYPNNFSTLDKMYHLNKTEQIEEKGFQLFHIFENEYIDSVKKNIWLSLLRNKLNLIPKDNIVYARKCHIREVSSADSREFQNQNHLQGYRGSKINLGLYYNDNLISLMTFSKPGFSKTYEYELIRFCSKINHRVIGGASKLLKYFERHYNPKSIVTYANRRWSIGNLYEALGFTFIRNSDPNYFYIKNGKLYSRNSFQKHMLPKKLELFDKQLTELQNMINNGYRIIYDSGNKVYSKIYHSKA